MTPTLPDRRQPRGVEQQLVRAGNRVTDERAIRDWIDGMAPAPLTRVERLSAGDPTCVAVEAALI